MNQTLPISHFYNYSDKILFSVKIDLPPLKQVCLTHKLLTTPPPFFEESMYTQPYGKQGKYKYPSNF